MARTSASPLASMVSLRATARPAPASVYATSALDAFAFQQRARHDAVEEHLHAGFAQQVIGGLAPDERVVHAGPGLAVAHRRRHPAARLEQPHELVGEAEDDLLARRAAVVGRGVQPHTVPDMPATAPPPQKP